MIVTRFAPSNALRFRPDLPRGHVESYFVRANHPTKKLAIWLKATVFAPRDHRGPTGAVAELWCIVFQGETGRVWAGKRTVPFAEASFLGEGPQVRLAGAELDLGPKGRSVGSLEGDGGPCRWDLPLGGRPVPDGTPDALAPVREAARRPNPHVQDGDAAAPPPARAA